MSGSVNDGKVTVSESFLLQLFELLATTMDVHSTLTSLSRKMDAMSQTNQQALQQVIDRLTKDDQDNAAASTRIETLVTSLAEQLRAAIASAQSTEEQVAAVNTILDHIENRTSEFVALADAQQQPSPQQPDSNTQPQAPVVQPDPNQPASATGGGAIAGGSADVGTTTGAVPDQATRMTQAQPVDPNLVGSGGGTPQA
jgi:hypothetical protein